MLTVFVLCISEYESECRNCQNLSAQLITYRVDGLEVEVEGEVGEDTGVHRQAEFPVGAVTLNVVVLVVETVTVVVVAEIVAGGAP